jgi:hypothetical protein
MDPQTYVEFDTNLQVAQFEEWVGREYCRTYHAAAVLAEFAGAPFAQAYFANDGAEYPYPPDAYYGAGEPGPEAYTWFYTRAVPKAAAGGVFMLYDDILTFATQAQVLSNGATYSFDIANNQKTADQLSPAGQAAITPPS